MNHIAHIRESDKEIQLLKTHLMESKQIAELLGSKLNLKYVAGLCGLLHDIGKYNPDFQTYIYEAVFHPDENIYKRGEIDHSTAGGKLIFELLHQKKNTPYEKLLAEIVGNAIISHHSNLKDYLSTERGESPFLSRVLREIPNYDMIKESFFEDVISFSELQSYIQNAVKEIKQLPLNYKTSVFITKYIFSCLIDADRTNTRNFENGKPDKTTVEHSDFFYNYYNSLMQHLDQLKNNGKRTPINALREKMSQECEDFASKPSDIYTLSIPTGGGKTLASFRYALKHSLEYQKQRIIYIVPYTTIIEQNANEIRNILNDDEHILEHHSNVIEQTENEYDAIDDGYIAKKQKLKLAKDNWDSPIIFTTLVQFLNVFYAKGNRNTRRLHNLANAVIIFDEVQKVPTKCVSLFNEAVNFLKRDAHSSVILCTATQPTLENVSHPIQIKEEIIQNLDEVADAFKRVDIIDKSENPMTNQNIADWIIEDINQLGSTLVILNTKSVVKELYELLKNSNIPVYHLSTSMCAAHRKESLETIRAKLNEQEPFVCVTTQLIEAGVDVSFDCVIRSVAGLDSIAQAAGRCNRNGKYQTKPVYIIQHAQEKLSRLKEIKFGKEASAPLLAMYRKKPERYNHSLLSQKAMKEYFINYYQKNEADLTFFVPKIERHLFKISLEQRPDEVKSYKSKTSASYPLLLKSALDTTAKYFQVIDDNTTSLIVPYDRGKDIIAELNSNQQIDKLSVLLKSAQQYSIQVYPQVFQELVKEQALVSHFDGMIYELKDGFYDEEYGLDLQGNSQLEDLFF
ncbi:CRISPR-associated helicase Cas3' [Oceanobacillus sp. J11TS1]|uniref:CRISPR-associated helicase Cas3' n=1 Tax=Oceanobacillus sp. J11TS1 TaxID=2807191 RepID=UPI001B0A9BDF|nr:CRISPR-associated helicase Cas3' [Oceanobacillus sp. J11TS1]GIO23494.1 CRISPR-associated helicase/endonuclease Cas3 [Oceanobacillus sp. J11TS1]